MQPWLFPFGQSVRDVVQTDCSPKQVFVLGVYSSAVHAQWVGPNNKSIVNALAVASEPYIFWRGDHAEEIINQISIPPELGRLLPAHPQFNGPSGIALDELILNPLGKDRESAWLCDLVPHSCVNPSQMAAIERAYLPVADQYGLPNHSVPSVPAELADFSRREEILADLRMSNSSTLILLGDKPIEWFLKYFDHRWHKLADFGRDAETYGRLHSVMIGNREIMVLPLAHPRQIARLGHSSSIWYDLHQEWLKRYARQIIHL